MSVFDIVVAVCVQYDLCANGQSFVVENGLLSFVIPKVPMFYNIITITTEAETKIVALILIYIN